ncbi:MAG TPA: hypothetical protein DCE65_04495 [Clostridiales bacterium]|nr:hypothetical protein [Clostridiales bacterium]
MFLLPAARKDTTENIGNFLFPSLPASVRFRFYIILLFTKNFKGFYGVSARLSLFRDYII